MSITAEEISSLNRGLLERLRMIDFIVDHFGMIQRKHVMDYFGISTPQASADLGCYRELAPNNLQYDKTKRTYLKAGGFKRIFP